MHGYGHTIHQMTLDGGGVDIFISVIFVLSGWVLPLVLSGVLSLGCIF